MHESRNIFEKQLTANIGVFTWNLAGKQPPFNMDINDLLLPDTFGQKDESPPDFYIVGLQEMVELEVIGSVICAKDKERMMQWE